MAGRGGLPLIVRDVSVRSRVGAALPAVLADTGRAAWCIGVHPVFMVGTDADRVEGDLAAGRLCCPACCSALSGWGYARQREVRDRVGGLVLRPRRVICRSCDVTHVLLPASVLLRRADTVGVIGAALLAKAGGAGHRRVAAVLDRPAGTVRGWLRRIRQVADRVRALFGELAAELGGEFVVPEPAGSPVGDVVAFIGAVAAAAARRLGSCDPWRLAAAVTAGRLLAPAGPPDSDDLAELINTSWLWAAPV